MAAAEQCRATCKLERHKTDQCDGLPPCPNACRFAPLDCGGSCCLTTGHDGEHQCIGDDPGQPGSCPA